MAESPVSICRRVIYRGRVQGVGFRWTTHRIAQSFDVTGYVRNCVDGSVELLVQGPPDQVAALQRQLATVMAGNIEQAQESEESFQADLSGFSIRR